MFTILNIFQGKLITFIYFFLQIINTYSDAVQTVDPKLAVGKLHTLWVAFAKFYEKNKQHADADMIFEKATKVPYQKVDDLASVWCEWAQTKMDRE